MAAEKNAKKDPDMPVVTGRARNSITWATKEREGKPYVYKDDSGTPFETMIGHGAKKTEVFIGSNVKYFPKIENGGGGHKPHHILKKAATDHSAEYKALIKESLEKAQA